MKKRFKIIINTFLVVTLVLTIFLAFISFFQKDLILSYIDMIGEIIKSWGYWNFLIIFLFAFFESFPLIGTSIPGQLVLIMVAGFLGYDYMYFSMLFASIGGLLGNYLGYILGIRYGDIFFKKYGPWIGIGQTDIKYIKKGIDKQGRLFVVFGKFHNLFRAFVPFIAGTLSMKSKHFTLANIVGSCLRAVVMVLLGVFFVQNAEVVLKNVGKVIIFIVILFALYIFFFKKKERSIYLNEKNEEFDKFFTKDSKK